MAMRDVAPESISYLLKYFRKKRATKCDSENVCSKLEGQTPANKTHIVPEIDSKETKCSKRTNEDRVYNYDEAIDLAGNGMYSVGLLATVSMATLAMGVDMFGFSVVVTGATCDFQLTLEQTSILMAITFIGPIVMAYPWGYMSDTQGRKKSLVLALWTSLVISIASAFSPDWITLAVFKFISTCFSSCATSVTYTHIGESCPQRIRDSYMLIITSILDFSLAIYTGVAYVISNMEFSYDLGFITFTPWRLLTLVLTTPTALGALGLMYFYESPKFLLNAHRDEEALEALAGIWRRNRKKGEYPVKKVILEEYGNRTRNDVGVLRSLWEQFVPLFKPPLLGTSLLMYFLVAVVYSTNNSYFMWFPYLAEKFVAGSSSADADMSICTLIVSAYNNSTTTTECSSKMNISVFWATLIQGGSFVVVTLCLSRVAHMKRLLVIVILAISSASSLASAFVTDQVISFVMFLGLLVNEVIMAIFFSYFVDLYPTSYRGMAACIDSMVARSSALGGTALLGRFVMTHCNHAFYICSALMMGGVVVAFLLPADKPRQPKTCSET